MKPIVLVLLAASLAAPAIAADQPAPPKPKPHLICKRTEDTGSHLSARICKTAEEWAGSSVDQDSNKLQTMARGSTTGDGSVPQ